MIVMLRHNYYGHAKGCIWILMLKVALRAFCYRLHYDHHAKGRVMNLLLNQMLHYETIAKGFIMILMLKLVL